VTRRYVGFIWGRASRWYEFSVRNQPGFLKLRTGNWKLFLVTKAWAD
jgi:hypothetical protein